MDHILLSRGQKYPLETNNGEGATANFLLKGSNYLQIILHGMSKEDERVLRYGKIRCGFLYEHGAMLFLFQFFDGNNSYLTMDAQYDVRLIPTEDRELPSITNENQRLAFEIHGIDEKNILRALRLITMPPDMTIAFFSAVQEQLVETKSGELMLKKWFQCDPGQLILGTKTWMLGK